MRNNVKNVEKLPEKEVIVYSFDKNGKRFEKKVKNNDRFLVTLTNNDSVVLKESELKLYGIHFEKIVAKASSKVEDIEDLDEEDDIVTENVEQSNPSIA